MPIKRFLALAAILALPHYAGAFFIPYTPYTVEFVNSISGHYVLVRDPMEVAAIESGAAGPGWKRTGEMFNVALPGSGGDGTVCRFYSPAANSHFHTAFASECEFLRANPQLGWIFEKHDFAVALPTGGSCGNMQPVYRLFNNGGTRNDPNHRFTTLGEVRDEMVAQGWTYEGVAFCTTAASRLTPKRYAIDSRKLAPTAECEDESLNLGSCVALNQLPRMPNFVQAFLPPSFVVSNPDFPSGAAAVTGVMGHDLRTAYPIQDKAAVISHSFLQTYGVSSWFGIHVNSADRTVGDLSSINPLYQFTTATPAAGQQDGRLFPWGDGRDNHLELSFKLTVATLVRDDPQSHAYGHPTLQFVDRTTGQHLYVTLGTYGSVTGDGEDYLARDTGTGRVIVSTTFRADPSFGKVLSGREIRCPGDGACVPAATNDFRFRIDRAAFATVLAKARTLAPGFSPNPYDYFVANFHFNNEVYRNGRIGLVLSDYLLEVYDR